LLSTSSCKRRDEVGIRSISATGAAGAVGAVRAIRRPVKVPVSATGAFAIAA
jgi:hypothetical protein